jgi:Antitoxin VbhA
MCLSAKMIEKRQDALRQARVDSQIEGQRAHPDDAKLLDAFARGEIDGDEVTRRIIARGRAVAKTKRQKTAA